MLENAPPDTEGILLKYQQSSSSQPRMVFSFGFAKAGDIDVTMDERVQFGPKPNEGLFVHQTAFMKVLGCTIHVSEEDGMPYIKDREGFEVSND
jgi:hypothetical protein